MSGVPSLLIPETHPLFYMTPYVTAFLSGPLLDRIASMLTLLSLFHGL